jgi:hypothetical protein
MRTLATAKLKRIRALELVAEGLSYDEVAEAVGYGHRGSAYRAVSRALKERLVDGVDELRAVEVARLDRLQAAVWDEAMTGDLRAVNAVIRIIGQRARLLGLDGQACPDHLDAGSPVLVVGSAEGNPGEATGEPRPGEDS